MYIKYFYVIKIYFIVIINVISLLLLILFFIVIIAIIISIIMIVMSIISVFVSSKAVRACESYVMQAILYEIAVWCLNRIHENFMKVKDPW